MQIAPMSNQVEVADEGGADNEEAKTADELRGVVLKEHDVDQRMKYQMK